jgi:DNA damage-inducible protein 1
VFIDTGAQITVMNSKTVEKGGLTDLIDSKCTGQVVGVGTQQMLGRIHCVEMFVGSHALSCSFTILDNGPDIIFGLNMMLSHGCKLDLKDKYIEIGNEKIQFLNDVPDTFEQLQNNKND